MFGFRPIYFTGADGSIRRPKRPTVDRGERHQAKQDEEPMPGIHVQQPMQPSWLGGPIDTRLLTQYENAT
ncbi:hypothetical protein A2U01_0025910 [Trifolium medium]|uniref:Uncharacterized protein n=1 Tax=Trifolium medium TaxID=97028 RepID=A0A392NZG9_9FABA|nr:hypothetical protein [Trifolium medium]